ncbi:SH3 beta-barrel fold-containing protein [Salmonirosea aquatica]|uniref:DUF2693 domain-containing protein n=1 Tax=Salmonirosea aquatica TaxID=2654236 RepID=A0A7C9BKZ4_9BACT|nr:DUF2693 domain-containing protein [Cytophagaceae bacterium SJW1-29]
MKIQAQAMQMAHAIKSRYLNFGLALSAAWKAVKLRRLMQAGQAAFAFTKKDGSIRHAVGTRSAGLIPAAFAPKSPSQPTTLINFFDVEIQQWRSCQPWQLN